VRRGLDDGSDVPALVDKPTLRLLPGERELFEAGARAGLACAVEANARRDMIEAAEARAARERTEGRRPSTEATP
jgi:hypothetical protein